MVDLRQIRERIQQTEREDEVIPFTRRWLEEVERDLVELQLLRIKQVQR